MRSSRGPSKVIYSQNRPLSLEAGGGVGKGSRVAMTTLRLVRTYPVLGANTRPFSLGSEQAVTEYLTWLQLYGLNLVGTVLPGFSRRTCPCYTRMESMEGSQFGPRRNILVITGSKYSLAHNVGFGSVN